MSNSLKRKTQALNPLLPQPRRLPETRQSKYARRKMRSPTDRQNKRHVLTRPRLLQKSQIHHTKTAASASAPRLRRRSAETLSSIKNDPTNLAEGECTLFKRAMQTGKWAERACTTRLFRSDGTTGTSPAGPPGRSSSRSHPPSHSQSRTLFPALPPHAPPQAEGPYSPRGPHPHARAPGARTARCPLAERTAINAPPRTSPPGPTFLTYSVLALAEASVPRTLHSLLILLVNTLIIIPRGC